jgi:3-oxoacyl-[acyl-carrier protein] reductase
MITKSKEMPDKYALITGGTKGIGFAVAESIAQMGYNLILTYNSDSNTAAGSQSHLSMKYGVEVSVLQADSSKRASIDIICEFVAKNNITLDALIFNAGLTTRESFEEIQYEEWEKVFFANIHFPVFLLRRLLKNLSKGGSIIFTGSLMGIFPHAMSLSYGVTKSSVHALVKNLVKFLAPYEIRVNAVAPGFVDTEWQKNKPAEIRKSIENKIALQRFGSPEEIAEIYRLLIVNSYINGEIIVADGGYSYK